MTFLHGNMSLKLLNATDLPDMDFSILPFRKEVSDPYLKVQAFLNDEKVLTLMKSKVIEQDLNPHWNEKFHIPVCLELDELRFYVKDFDLRQGDDTMGEFIMNVDELLEAEDYVVKGWFPLTLDGEEKGRIRMKLKYKPVSAIDFHGLEVARTMFPLRRHCGIKLYQSAHTPCVSPVIDVPTVDGEPYEPSSYFVDAVAAMENAQKLIYIAGWSVNAEICLLRDGAEETEKLGELLKRKADEGVCVLVMIWNELFSRDGVVELPGLMGTHDEETVAYFEGTNVKVLNAPRKYCDGLRVMELFVSGNFTHHQKCVITDKEIEDDERRRIVAFVGGIDLTDGRWDTPEYKLFPSLPYEHKHDFYQNLLTSQSNIGPREPWHDIHSYVEGKAAVDVLQNYSERWRKQGEEEHAGCLYFLDEDEFDLNAASSEGINGGNWNVQFFRSITEDSVIFDTGSRQFKCLRHTKGKIYESSIHDAYVYHIRRAKKFIYMENQYFLGSSFCWPTPDIDAANLIPLELVMRVIRAIKEGEDFRVYIVTPMFPEGLPTSHSVQEILAFQYYTKQAMYKRIAEALEEAGSDAHPTDYLTFFCLTKRESPDDVPEDLDMPDGEDEILENVRKTLRSMIYVHSKMAIFDDEYIIVGSANVNQRSMDGTRDTEMCIGAFQSDFVNSDDELKGYVQRFRLALWASHCGETMDVHLQPSSLDCMTAMKEMGQANLEKYVEYEPEHNPSQLMFYPLNVTQDGQVLSHESFPEVPDLGGPIAGKQTNFIPRFITT